MLCGSFPGLTTHLYSVFCIWVTGPGPSSQLQPQYSPSPSHWKPGLDITTSGQGVFYEHLEVIYISTVLWKCTNLTEIFSMLLDTFDKAYTSGKSLDDDGRIIYVHMLSMQGISLAWRRGRVIMLSTLYIIDMINTIKWIVHSEKRVLRQSRITYYYVCPPHKLPEKIEKKSWVPCLYHIKCHSSHLYNKKIMKMSQRR